MPWCEVGRGDVVTYAEFKGGSFLSQSSNSFEKQLGVCLVGSAGRAFWAEETISTKIRTKPGFLPHQRLAWLQLDIGPLPDALNLKDGNTQPRHWCS